MDIRQFGGAAFPRTQDVWPDPDNPAVADTVEAQEGMSLLDWFAGQALDGVIDRSREMDFDSAQGYHAWIADEAYDIAFAMLDRRRLLVPELPNDPSELLAEGLRQAGVDVRFVDVTPEETPVMEINQIDVSNVSLNNDGSLGLGFRVVSEEAIDAAVAAEEEESTAGAGE